MLCRYLIYFENWSSYAKQKPPDGNSLKSSSNITRLLSRFWEFSPGLIWVCFMQSLRDRVATRVGGATTFPYFAKILFKVVREKQSQAAYSSIIYKICGSGWRASPVMTLFHRSTLITLPHARILKQLLLLWISIIVFISENRHAKVTKRFSNVFMAWETNIYWKLALGKHCFQWSNSLQFTYIPQCSAGNIISAMSNNVKTSTFQ